MLMLHCYKQLYEPILASIRHIICKIICKTQEPAEHMTSSPGYSLPPTEQQSLHRAATGCFSDLACIKEMEWATNHVYIGKCRRLVRRTALLESLFCFAGLDSKDTN